MAKKRKLITRRRLKWVGVISSGLLVATAIGTLLAGYRCLWVAEGDVRTGRYVAVESGSLYLAYEPHGSSYAGTLEYIVGDLTGFSTDFGGSWNWWFEYKTDHGEIFWLIVPLWVPLALIATPSAWLWRTDRRAKPWQCAKCRYDLRGLAGEGNGAAGESKKTTCPECGTATNA